MTSLLPESTMAALRAIQEARMPEMAEEVAQTRVTGALGGTTDAWTTVLQSFPCRLARDTTAQDVTTGSVNTTRQLWRITGPAGITLASSSRLRVNSKLYAVIGTDGPHSYASVTNISCYEVS